jgi:hypothetical protein
MGRDHALARPDSGHDVSRRLRLALGILGFLGFLVLIAPVIAIA